MVDAGSDHFGEDFVSCGEEGDGAPLLDLLSVSPFGEETNHASREALWHLTAAENV